MAKFSRLQFSGRISLSVALVALIGAGAASQAAARSRFLAGKGHGSAARANTCSETAHIAFGACGLDTQDNYLTAQAKCLNVTDGKKECLADARSTKADERSECRAVRDARLGVCNALTLGGGPYDPPIDPSRFVSADAIDGNEYMPLKPGTKWVYTNTDGETITVNVTDQTAEIAGVPVRVVSDVVVDDEGKTTENTLDWFAEDVDNNVWYFGESTTATDPDSMLLSTEGSWETGVDGAKPGIVMPAVFNVGDVYRQEWLLGDAEDVAENLSATATESSPAASCSGTCLETHEYSPLEPDQSESKFYASGVGVIVTLDDNDPEFREELASFTPAP